MSKIKYLLATLGLIAGLGFSMMPVGVSAAPYDPCADEPNGVLCKNKDADIMINVKNIVNTMLFVLGALAVTMVIFGGVKYVLSAGDAKKVETAKNTILYAIIGVVVAALAGVIVNFVLTSLV